MPSYLVPADWKNSSSPYKQDIVFRIAIRKALDEANPYHISCIAFQFSQRPPFQLWMDLSVWDASWIACVQ